MTIGYRSNEQKKKQIMQKYSPNKTKKSQIISIKTKLKIFKEKPNKTYRKLKKEKK
jgi:hypothetical protein